MPVAVDMTVTERCTATIFAPLCGCDGLAWTLVSKAPSPIPFPAHRAPSGVNNLHKLEQFALESSHRVILHGCGLGIIETQNKTIHEFVHPLETCAVFEYIHVYTTRRCFWHFSVLLYLLILGVQSQPCPSPRCLPHRAKA